MLHTRRQNLHFECKTLATLNDNMILHNCKRSQDKYSQATTNKRQKLYLDEEAPADMYT